MLNVQRPVRQFKDNATGILSVFRVWETIQGEGPFQGLPAVFVRLNGCNLQCPLCDTDYTSQHESWTADGLADFINATYPDHKLFNSKPLLVITGGEPFNQNFGPFAREIIQRGWQVQVETNGTIFQEDVPVLGLFIVCSPKTPTINHNLKPYIKALKYVLRAGEVSEADGLPISVLGLNTAPERPWLGFKGDVFVQPCDESDKVLNAANLKATMKSSLRFGYRIGLQLHKILGVE